MTINPFGDGNALIGAALNGMINAHSQDGIISGVTPSKGAGSYDVDIASGTALIDNDLITVAADTVTLTSAAADADLDAGEFRVDTLTVDGTGTVNVAEGTAAVTPIAPDIPTDEALVALVIVDGSASSITSGDIRDRRTIVKQESDYILVEDDNSPVSHSGSASFSYTLADTYDMVQVIVTDYVPSGGLSTEFLRLTVNNDTGANYRHVIEDGTSQINANSVPVIGSETVSNGALFQFAMSGQWSNNWGVNIQQSSSSNEVADQGLNDTVSSPASTFELTDDNGAWSGDVTVYGVNF